MVAFELRTPHTLRLADRAGQTEVWEKVKERLPIVQTQQALQVTLGAPGMVQTQGPLRMHDRSRTLGVVVGSDAIVIESTDYRSHQEFFEFLRYVLAAVPAAEVAGFSRIGLRYINEIRVPGVALPAQWEGLIAPSLLAAIAISADGFSAHRLNAEVEYAGTDGLSVVMRHGAAAGRVVNADGPLRTRTRDTGPFFLLDLDSYWEHAAEAELPEFSTDAILETTSGLREPIHDLFELAITDRLRDIFRKEPS